MSELIETLKKELQSGEAQLFDVREKDEWDFGHIKQAKFVPLSELRVGLEPEDLSKDKKTYIYCRSGNRVHMAKPLLMEMGFDVVIALNEGFEDLADFGLEVEE